MFYVTYIEQITERRCGKLNNEPSLNRFEGYKHKLASKL